MPASPSSNNTPVMPKRIASVGPFVYIKSNLPRLDVPVTLSPFTARDHEAGEESFFARNPSAQPREIVEPTTRSANCRYDSTSRISGTRRSVPVDARFQGLTKVVLWPSINRSGVNSLVKS